MLLNRRFDNYASWLVIYRNLKKLIASEVKSLINSFSVWIYFYLVQTYQEITPVFHNKIEEVFT